MHAKAHKLCHDSSNLFKSMTESAVELLNRWGVEFRSYISKTSEVQNTLKDAFINIYNISEQNMKHKNTRAKHQKPSCRSELWTPWKFVPALKYGQCQMPNQITSSQNYDNNPNLLNPWKLKVSSLSLFLQNLKLLSSLPLLSSS